MIKICNLTKIYNSKKSSRHKALNNISFTLPDKGITFVLGKSGSGKSTLLNLLGGLDLITSGSINVDGNELSTIKERELANYRNTHIGFIFQDYHLLDELTVFENIILSLHLRREEGNDLVYSALERVGLKGYENRYPSELSGGERQRVAIARAIVKKPRIILADEPTGNLDNNTGTQIVKLLKELSSDCLIVVVSHNLHDAYDYADRIIELKKGVIVQDMIRNPSFNEELSFSDSEVLYPNNKVLTNDDVDLLNKHLKTGKYTSIKKINNKFVPYKEQEIKETKYEIINKNLSKKNTAKLSLIFLKSKIFTIIFSSLMASAIMIVFALAGSFVTFDSSHVIETKLEELNVPSISTKKHAEEKVQILEGDKYTVEVTEDDINSFSHLMIDDKIHQIYNFTLVVTTRNYQAGFIQTDFYTSPYINESLGTIVVDPSIIEQRYGSFELLSEAETKEDIGIYISDYLADCILSKNNNYSGKTYTDLTGQYISGAKFKYGYINGVYNINYKTRYQDLLKFVINNQNVEYKDLYSRQDFIEFTSEIYSLSGFNLSFNPNFYEAYINENTYTEYAWVHQLEVNGNVKNTQTDTHFTIASSQNKIDIGPNEMVMKYTLYNELFNTEYTTSTLKDFVPHETNIKSYRRYDINKEHPLIDENVKIVGLSTNGGFGFVGKDLFKRFKEASFYSHGLFFNSNSNISEIINISETLNFSQNLVIVDGIHTMTQIVVVFAPIFYIIAIVLFIAVILVITSFATKMIKVKMHDIGVLKALGSKNRTIVVIFGLQVLLVAILTTLISIFGYLILAGATNDLLLDSLSKIASSRVFFDLQFVSFNFLIVLLTTGITFVLSFLSLLVPMIRIRKIKPVKIIKTKE